MFQLAISVDAIDRAIIEQAIASLSETCTSRHANNKALQSLVSVLEGDLALDPWDEGGGDPTMPRMLPVPTLESAQTLAEVLDHAEYMGRVGDLSVDNDAVTRAQDMWHAVHCLWRGIAVMGDA